jgi:hypothetical protein
LKIFKFNDKNADGIWETGENSMEGVVFSVNGPANYVTATNIYGEAFIYNMPLGAYTVTENVPEGWMPTTNITQTITLGNSLLQELRFGNQLCGYLKVLKYNDHNGNGVQDSGEAGVGGVMFGITGPKNFLLVTTQYGEALTNCIPLGTYAIQEYVPEGWTNTGDNPKTVQVTSELLVTVSVGDKQTPVGTTTTVPVTTSTAPPETTTTIQPTTTTSVEVTTTTQNATAETIPPTTSTTDPVTTTTEQVTTTTEPMVTTTTTIDTTTTTCKWPERGKPHKHFTVPDIIVVIVGWSHGDPDMPYVLWTITEWANDRGYD